jgi:hypothetical protein
VTAAPSGAAPGATRWCGRAFGLGVESAVAIPGVPESPQRGGSRRVLIELAGRKELEAAWDEGDTTALVDVRDGARTLLSVAWQPGLGFRVWAPRYGLHLVAEDGRRIRLALPREPAWRRQRLLFAQSLPLAAVLQGLELFHASGVVADGRAVAFAAASGTGKTSVAVHLVARGAELLTDDVLALEPTANGVLAHPGAGLASVARSEVERISKAGRRRLGTVIGRTEKLQLAASPVAEPSLLSLIYFLRRVRRGSLEIEELSPPDPRRLLTSSYLSYLRFPARARRQLELCAQLERTARVFQVAVPPTVPADEVASALETHLLMMRP